MSNAVKRQVVTRQIYISKPDAADLYHALRTILDREGKSFNDWVYEQMQQYIKRHGSGNPNFSLDSWLKSPEFVAFPTLGETPSWRKMLQFDKTMLIELKNNAAAYASQAELLLRMLSEHEKHLKLGYRDQFCPYCGDENER